MALLYLFISMFYDVTNTWLLTKKVSKESFNFFTLIALLILIKLILKFHLNIIPGNISFSKFSFFKNIKNSKKISKILFYFYFHSILLFQYILWRFRMFYEDLEWFMKIDKWNLKKLKFKLKSYLMVIHQIYYLEFFFLQILRPLVELEQEHDRWLSIAANLAHNGISFGWGLSLHLRQRNDFGPLK